MSKRIKNLSIRNDVISHIVKGSIVFASIGITVGYYMYENQTQIVDNVSQKNIFIDEEGNICCYFNVGEHRITISRNDAYYHNIKAVDGYVIENVEVNGWRDNNKTTYVNNKPVIVKTSKVKNGKPLFDNFGIVMENETKYSKSYKAQIDNNILRGE